MNKLIYIFILIVFLGCINCSRDKSLSKEELESYLLDPENQLIQTIEKGDVKLEMYYKSKELLPTDEMQNNLQQGDSHNVRLSTDSLDYFVLRLSRNNNEIENRYAGHPDQLSAVVSYLNFYIANDLKMIVTQDTLFPAAVIYARTFGIAEATNILIAFKSHLKSRPGLTRIHFNDTMLETGASDFVFENKIIKSIPILRTEK